MSERLLACIVTFHPRVERLAELIDRLAPAADAIMLIDNGQTLDPHDPRWARYPTLLWRRPERNLGVAAALNLALDHAQAQGFAYLHTFDQDSLPAPGMVETLRAQAAASPAHTVAWGPVLVDEASGRQAPSMLPMRWRRRKCLLGPGQQRAVDHLITSGCLYAVAGLRQVGRFNEDLFIDYVDVEWSLRARRAGLQVLQVGDARMLHSIGQGSIAVLGWRLAVHAPLRSYYQVRNGAWLALQGALPLPWRLNDAWRSLQKLVLLLLLAGQRTQRLREALRGLRDAFTLRPLP